MDKYKEGVASIHANIRKILKRRKHGLRSYELRDLYFNRYGKHYAESGFTARLREMKDISCNLSTFIYSLEKTV